MAAASTTLDAPGNPESRGAGAPKSARDEAEALPRALGRYTLLRLLVRGGMGEVFLATPNLHGGIEGAERPCIIKKIRREYRDDPSFRARFLDEARVQSQLDDPGVAHIIEAAVDEHGDPFVALEYVEGRSLADVRARANKLGTPLPWADGVALCLEIASALAHVHERTGPSGAPLGIVHRDLSPQNVMVGFAGDVKLIDFGTARGENRRCQTVSGTVLAKPGYVAPEVARGDQATARADLYALGVMLWELVSGRRFLDGDAHAHAAAVAAGSLRPPKLAGDGGLARLGDGPVPDALDRVIAMLTEPVASARCASAREAARQLVEVLTSAPRRPVEERGVRARVRAMLSRLYPAEPGTSRVEFSRMVSRARALLAAESARAAEAAAELAITPSLRPKHSEPSPSPRLTRVPDALPGTRYRVLRHLGQGAAGEVLEAEHVDLGRRVAIKLLQARHGGSPEYVARFRREARAIAGLDHPNLVRVYDFGETAMPVGADVDESARELGGRLFFVMERLDGETLEAFLDRERGMDFRDACEIGIQVCRALEAAHGAGLVHRDLKPANLFLAKTAHGQQLKLLDFGVAKGPVDDVGARFGGPDRDRDDPNLSRAGALFGTPETMSPEQVAGGVVDARADLYALGCVLYQLLAGRPPFDAPSSILLMTAHVRETARSIRKVAPERGVPAAVEQVVMRALEKEPSLRFASATAMREALEDACFGGFFEPHPANASDDVERGPSRADDELVAAEIDLAVEGPAGDEGSSFVDDLGGTSSGAAHEPHDAPIDASVAFDDDAAPATTVSARRRRGRTTFGLALGVALVAATIGAWKAGVPSTMRAGAHALAAAAPNAPGAASSVARAASADVERATPSLIAVDATTGENRTVIVATKSGPTGAHESKAVATSRAAAESSVASASSAPAAAPTASSSAPASPADALATIDEHLGRGDVEGALVLARAAKVDGSVDALRAWAKSAYSSARYAEAHDAAVAWAGKASGAAGLEARLLDARALLAAGRDEEARERLHETLAKYPKSQEAKSMLRDLDALRPAEKLGRRGHPRDTHRLLGFGGPNRI